MNSNTTSYHQLWWTVILLHITELCQPAILSHNYQYCFPLPNHANHSWFEWVNFFSGDLWWCCIYSTILETLLRRHPHHHTDNPSPCSSGCFWLCLLCTSPNIYYKWDSRLKIIYFIQKCLPRMKYESSLFHHRICTAINSSTKIF